MIYGIVCDYPDSTCICVFIVNQNSFHLELFTLQLPTSFVKSSIIGFSTKYKIRLEHGFIDLSLSFVSVIRNVPQISARSISIRFLPYFLLILSAWLIDFIIRQIRRKQCTLHTRTQCESWQSNNNKE